MTRIKDFDESVIINDEFRGYLDGLLLGDGSLWIRSSCRSVTPMFSQGCIKSEWIKSISNYFRDHGIVNQVHTTQSKRIERGNEKALYHIDTRNYKEFIEFHNRWYKKWYDIDNYQERYWHFDKESGDYFVWKKVIPENIRLSPVCVANWYMGDGSLSNRKSGYDTLTLATNSFDRKSVDYLSGLLYLYYKISAKVTKRNEIIIYTPSVVNEFLDTVRPYIIPCFDYKLKYYR